MTWRGRAKGAVMDLESQPDFNIFFSPNRLGLRFERKSTRVGGRRTITDGSRGYR